MLRRLLTCASLFCVLTMQVRVHGQQPTVMSSDVSMLQPMLEILDRAKVSGSLKFSCPNGGQAFPGLPKLRAPTTIGASDIQVLREMFADDPAMQVPQQENGTIRMAERGVEQDILSVRINQILFGSGGANRRSGIYRATDALMLILWAPEVKAFARSHAIEGLNTGGSVPGNFAAWPAESPHISGSLNNVTVSEALDSVLKTFPGIWIYEDCPQRGGRQRRVSFRFVHLRKLGPDVSVE